MEKKTTAKALVAVFLIFQIASAYALIGLLLLAGALIFVGGCPTPNDSAPAPDPGPTPGEISACRNNCLKNSDDPTECISKNCSDEALRAASCKK